jgi:membrane-bound serine protease (ClpP class)
MTAGVVVAGRLAWQARRHRPASGTEGFAGQEIVMREASGLTGRVMFEGAWWTARSQGDHLAVGQPVRVVGLDDLTLLVEPVDGPTTKANNER